ELPRVRLLPSSPLPSSTSRTRGAKVPPCWDRVFPSRTLGKTRGTACATRPSVGVAEEKLREAEGVNRKPREAEAAAQAARRGSQPRVTRSRVTAWLSSPPGAIYRASPPGRRTAKL